MIPMQRERRVVGEVLDVVPGDNGEQTRCLTSYGGSVVLKNIVVPVPAENLQEAGVSLEKGICFTALVNTAAYRAPEVQPTDFAALPDRRGLWNMPPYDDMFLDII